MTIQRYSSSVSEVWDKFVRASRNGTFLFERAYMDYHSDRFLDHSLLFLNRKGNVIAVLPGCEIIEAVEAEGNVVEGEQRKIFSSHAGLTFGGFVLHKSLKAADVLELFSETHAYLRSNGFFSWVYKSVPFIYHSIPSEEEQYALWMNGAVLDVCNLSTTIDLHAPMSIAPDLDRARRRRKALEAGCVVEETDDFTALWPIVEKVLNEKHGVAPVHSLEEITLLKTRFPKNIRCFVAKLGGVVQGGVVIYESSMVAHAQYAETSDAGKALGASDLLYLYLIDYYKKSRSDIRYFDFGISNECRGRYLNRSLVFYKEDFGGRGVTYKTYILPL